MAIEYVVAQGEGAGLAIHKISANPKSVSDTARRVLGRIVDRQADAVVIVTDWKHFKAVDWQRIKGLMSHPIVVDGRNMHDPIEVSLHGIDYFSVGRVPAETEYGTVASDDLDASFDGDSDLNESVRTFGAD